MRKLVEGGPGLAILSVVFGLANAAALLGWRVINPTSISWLTADNATHYLGWAFFRFESGWTIPLSWTERVGYPAGATIAFLESVPLVAFLLRPFGSTLPEPFQYLGLYASACFVLQAYFGFSLCRRLFPGRPGFIVLGGAFFLLSPPLTWLVFGHYPHLSHWLIVAGFDSYFRDSTGLRPVHWLARFWALLAVAGGINPYLAAMCFLIALAGVGRLLLERKCSLGIATCLAGLTLVLLAGSLLTFGYLGAPDPSTYWAPGYGEFSLNLLAPINPMVFGSIVLPALPVTSNGQFEGYNYLGAGIIALLVLGLARDPRVLLRLFDRNLVPLVTLALVFTAAAVSSTISFGSQVLVQVELPDTVAALAHGLRASGRLFWPVHYLLIAGAISLTFWQWKPRYRTMILTAALAVQLADLTQLRQSVRAVGDQTVPDPLRSSAWKELGRTHENLMVVPAYQCGPELAPGGKPTYRIFGMLAAAQRMRTNSYYAARYTKREIQVHCVEVPAAVLKGNLDTRSAYVVSDAVRTVLELSPTTTSHRCETIDGFNLCTVSASRADSGKRMPKLVPYAVGDVLDFTAGGNARKYMTYGWATDSGSDGTWTDGPLAKLVMGLEAPIERALFLTLNAGARPFVTPRNPQLDVEVAVNGEMVERWTFRYGQPETERHMHVPARVTAGHRMLDLEFRFLNPEAPAYVGAGPDGRLLGLNVRGVQIRPEP